MNWLHLEFSHTVPLSTANTASRASWSSRRSLCIQHRHDSTRPPSYPPPRTATGSVTATTSSRTSDTRSTSSALVHHLRVRRPRPACLAPMHQQSDLRRRSPRARALHLSGGPCAAHHAVLPPQWVSSRQSPPWISPTSFGTTRPGLLYLILG